MIHMGIFKRKGIEGLSKIKSRCFDGCNLVGYIENDILGMPVPDEEAEFSAIWESSITVTRSKWIIVDREEFPRFNCIANGRTVLADNPEEDFGIVAEKMGSERGFSLPPHILGEEWLKRNSAKVIPINWMEEREGVLKERFDGYDFESLGKGIVTC